MVDYKWNHSQTRACDDGARAAGQRLTCGAPSRSQVFVFLCICAMSCICCLCICFVLSLAGEAHIKFSDNSSIINQTIQRVNDWQLFSGASWDTSLTGASSPSFLFPLQAQPTHLITDDIRSNVTKKIPNSAPSGFPGPWKTFLTSRCRCTPLSSSPPKPMVVRQSSSGEEKHHTCCGIF